jgi:hypothetical protein
MGVLLHAPMAFWNLFSSPPSSCVAATCCMPPCPASSGLLSSGSAPPSIRARGVCRGMAACGGCFQGVRVLYYGRCLRKCPRNGPRARRSAWAGAGDACGQLSPKLGSAAAR